MHTGVFGLAFPCAVSWHHFPYSFGRLIYIDPTLFLSLSFFTFNVIENCSSSYNAAYLITTLFIYIPCFYDRKENWCALQNVTFTVLNTKWCPRIITMFCFFFAHSRPMTTGSGIRKISYTLLELCQHGVWMRLYRKW